MGQLLSLIAKYAPTSPGSPRLRAPIRLPPAFRQLFAESTIEPIPPLLDCPVDILLLVFASLPLPDQVCLALTCKPLYNLFSEALKDPRLAWPKGIEATGCAAYARPNDHPRLELLLRLQTYDNVYCTTCLKLHRRQEFTEESLAIPIIDRRCKYGHNVVDLCHCLALTPMTGAKLRQWLDTGVAPAALDRSIRNAFVPGITDGDELSLQHECRAIGRKYGDLALATRLRHMPDKTLVVRTYHDLRISGENVKLDPWQLDEGISVSDTIFSCPHNNLVDTHWSDRSSEPKFCTHCETVQQFFGQRNGLSGKGTLPGPDEILQIWETQRTLGHDDKDCPRWQQTARARWKEKEQLQHCLKLRQK
ncbi:hypothetical protein BJY01DRAFT_252332 [Aspergillus pseudoustus]|uniref:F-box domain-containing protein n=1 Tax=Aspergillus pseudoustus TaxID=1810923 RepID=A0ABR4J9T1_9EURO